MGGCHGSLAVTQQPNHPLEGTKPMHSERGVNSQLSCSLALIFQVAAPPCEVLMVPAPALDLSHRAAMGDSLIHISNPLGAALTHLMASLCWLC